MLGQLLNHIDCYLVEECSLQELETWILSNLQDILDSGDCDAIAVANQVDVDLVELRENLIDEVTLRERFENYITVRKTVPVTFSEIECAAITNTSTSDETLTKRWEEPTPVNLHLDLVFS